VKKAHKTHKTHKCSICFSSDHNKRTCEYWLWTQTTPLFDAGEDEEEDGHQTTENYNTPSPEEDEVEGVTITVKKTRKCSLCGQCGHNKTTCGVKQSTNDQEPIPIFATSFDKSMKRKITCSLCSENGHNSRTCSLKCSPCSDQVARSYCFANLSATKAASMARILECSSIYDEK
jgi:hypothetical protein